MAIGLARMFGFHFKENFNYPYLATSATDFWRRWHISLGSFFRDYLYIPLGGSRKRIAINSMIVWSLTGLWHGASWNFVIWGLYYGVLILAEKGLNTLTERHAPRPVAYPYMILVTLVGWSLFYFEDPARLFRHIQTLFGITDAPIMDSALKLSLASHALFLPVAIISCFPIWPWLRARFEIANEQIDALKPARYEFATPAISVSLLFLSTIMLVGKTYNPFLYFRF